MKSNLHLPEAQIAELCRKYSVKELMLFGSALRDDFTDTSDVDFIVDFLPTAETTFPELIRFENQLSQLIGRDVDLVSKNGLKPKFSKMVLPTAQRVYAV